MKNPHLAERTVSRDAVDGKRVFTGNEMKEFRVWWSTDRRLVEFHLDPADAPDISGVYSPFSPLAVTLEKITPPCHAN